MLMLMVMMIDGGFMGDKIIQVVPVKLIKVQDGDTIEVETNEKFGLKKRVWVRFIGMDAPETGQANEKALNDSKRISLQEMNSIGEAATSRLKELIGDKKIYLHFMIGNDPDFDKTNLPYDRFKRLLAYVTVGNQNGPDLGKVLIDEGFALVWPRGIRSSRFVHPKTVQYISACNSARNAQAGLWKKGMWKLCRFGMRPELKIDLLVCTTQCHPSCSHQEDAEAVLNGVYETESREDDDRFNIVEYARNAVRVLMEEGHFYGFRFAAGHREFLSSFVSATTMPDESQKKIMREIMGLLTEKMLKMNRKDRAMSFQLLYHLFAVVFDEFVEECCEVSESTVYNYMYSGPSTVMLNAIANKLSD